jgi:hypothetical protein
MAISEQAASTGVRRAGSPFEVLLAFLKLGVTCFGGPIAPMARTSAISPKLPVVNGPQCRHEASSRGPNFAPPIA